MEMATYTKWTKLLTWADLLYAVNLVTKESNKFFKISIILLFFFFLKLFYNYVLEFLFYQVSVGWLTLNQFYIYWLPLNGGICRLFA